MIERCQHQVRKSLFGTDGHNGFGFRIDLNVIAFLVPAGNRPTQTRNTARSGITVRIRALRHGTQFFNNVRRRGPIRVPHAEVDNIFAAPTRSHLQFSRDVKNVRGKAINTRKATFRAGVSHNILRLTLAPGPSERRCHDGGTFRK